MRTTFDTPIGPLTLVGDDDGALSAVLFGNEPYTGSEPSDPDALGDARRAFERYFDADPHAFDGLALRFDGTPLQRDVWDALIALPFGAVTTYGALARSLGVRSARAVGSANARTPIPIVMACHRVVGSTGALTGYRGGLPVKRALLAFEASGGDLSALRAELGASV